MSSLSTFGTFTMARMGVWVAQQSLNVTGNNISNINKEGYSRQQINLNNISATGADRYQSKYDVRITGGAVADSVVQMRDQYLDIRYRDEASSVGAMDAKLDGLEQLATIIDEVGRGEDGEGVIEAAFENLIQQIETFSAQGAGKDAFDSIFRDAASTLVEKIRNRANQLDTLMGNMTKGFEQDVQEVNSILERIRDLNSSIRRTQVYGGQPLTEIDERNNLIDDLAEFMHIDVNYEQEDLGEGYKVDKLVIKTAGLPTRTLVDGVYAAQLSIRQVQDKDDNGEPRYYINGDPVMVNSSGFEIELSPLMDVNRRLMTSPDQGAVAVTMNPTVEKDDLTSTTGATTFTEEEARQIAGILNNDESVYKETDENGDNYFYFHPYQEPDGNWYIHKHPVSGDASTAANRADNSNTSSYTYTQISVGYTAALATGSTPATAYDTADAAQEIANQLATREKQSDRSSAIYSYSVAENGDGKFEIHRNLDGTELNDTELYGALQSTREMLTEKGYYATAQEVENDVNAATKRGIPYYQKSLDTLANTFANMLNEANMLSDPDHTIYVYEDPNRTLYQYDTSTDASGNTVYTRKTDSETGDYLLSANAATVFDSSVNKAEIDDHGYYVLQKSADEAGYSSGGVLFSNDGNDNKTDHISAANISISKSWANGSFRVLSSTKPDAASTESDNLNRILVNILKGDHEFDPRMDGLNTGDDLPKSEEIFFTGSFQELLSSHIAGFLGNDQGVAETALENYSVMLDEIYVQRESVMGVDLNDEAVNMMMYQKSYAAACRLMTMYDEMLDKLINGT